MAENKLVSNKRSWSTAVRRRAEKRIRLQCLRLRLDEAEACQAEPIPDVADADGSSDEGSSVGNNNSSTDSFVHMAEGSHDPPDPDCDPDTDPDSDPSSDDDEQIFVEEPNLEVQAFRDREEQVTYLRSFLSDWALRSVTFKKVDQLLVGLRPLFPELCKSYKSLLKTPKFTGIESVGQGELWYKGFELNLEQRLTQDYLDKYNEIVVDINIDGLQLYESGPQCFWPILGCLQGQKTPFIIACFYGSGKPHNLHQYLYKFVREARSLQLNGYEIFDKVYPFLLRNFILDAPARSFVKCCTGHTASVACEKCTIRGRRMYNWVIFSGVDDGQLRSDESFSIQEQGDHHVGVSPLDRDLHLKMVSQFRLDVMHMVHGGVFKRWLSYLFGILHRKETAEEVHVRRLNREAGIRQPRFKPHGVITAAAKNAINDALLNVAPSVPHDFNRRPRSLAYISYFKCKEFRRILLYDGVLVLKGNVCDETYRNFLLLHTGMYILSSPSLVKQEHWLAVARLVLDEFVSGVPGVFDDSFVVYNVHCLKHLTDECIAHGEADSFSAYKYENYLGVMRGVLRSRDKPLQQLANRDSECSGWLMSSNKSVHDEVDLDELTLSKQRKINDKLPECHECDQYREFSYKGFKVSVSVSDCCFKTVSGEIFLLTNVIYNTVTGKVFLAGHKFKKLEDYYRYPVNSSELGIVKVSMLDEGQTLYRPVSKFQQKCVLLPETDSVFVCIPLLEYTSQ